MSSITISVTMKKREKKGKNENNAYGRGIKRTNQGEDKCVAGRCREWERSGVSLTLQSTFQK